MKLTPAASIRTTACPGPGWGSGTSSYRSGPPGEWTRTAFTIVVPFSDRRPDGRGGAGGEGLLHVLRAGRAGQAAPEDLANGHAGDRRRGSSAAPPRPGSGVRALPARRDPAARRRPRKTSARAFAPQR